MNETEESKIVLEKNKIVLMDFSATWCIPCKMQDPILEELKKKLGHIVEFMNIDVDKNHKLANKYNIHAVPTLIIEKDGNTIARYVGITSSKTLEEKINEILK